jgi:hypothetical protein
MELGLFFIVDRIQSIRAIAVNFYIVATRFFPVLNSAWWMLPVGEPIGIVGCLFFLFL